LGIKTVIYNAIKRIIFLSVIISISLASYTKGQNPKNPIVSFKVVNMPIGEVLNILELKTNYTFSYLNEELSLNK
jgi:hypothetical protein